VRSNQSPVHPHGRGERLPRATADQIHDGSSPRAWGTALGKITVNALNRFIPTGVGNGNKSFSPTLTYPVHPHGRGERQK